jgi:cell wall-associated NlpC family hydrolase
MKHVLVRAFVVAAVAAAGAVSLAAPPAFASGPYTNTSTAVRHCTYLPDASCQQIKWYIPPNTSVSMRCWTDESWFAGTNRWFWIDGNGVQGFVSANNISSQTTVSWCNGMPEMQAVRWAGSHLGEQYDVGWCLQFVHDAWANWGSGIDIGAASDALTYWNNHPAQQVPGAVYAPVGALVFWGATSGNPYGHVAISIGDAYAISTYERSTYEVHVLNMNERNNQGYPYLGYILPTW